MKNMSTQHAINHVLSTELARDRRTVYLGETVRASGATGASFGLYDRFGDRQVIETPVSENAIFSAALGLAIAGYRPIVEIYSADFALVVANEIMNDMTKWRQQQNWPDALPITVRGWMGSTSGLGPEHSQCVEAYFHHAPGLVIVTPGTPGDTAGLLRSAIRDDRPTLVLEHRKLYGQTGDVDDGADFTIPLSRAATLREGTDVTLIAWANFRSLALEAAETVSDSVSVEVIDPLTIKPMDFDTIVASVEKTGCLLVTEESPITGNIGAEIVARVAGRVTRPIRVGRVAMPDVVHPYSAAMEPAIFPDVNDMAVALRALAAGLPVDHAPAAWRKALAAMVSP